MDSRPWKAGKHVIRASFRRTNSYRIPPESTMGQSARRLAEEAVVGEDEVAAVGVDEEEEEDVVEEEEGS